ncbi:MAG: SDR family oxidoreductase [Methylobacteriaceae bacterium]|nr:SDR family oxidoreductase [Methylobacteriaceae bacterium]
MAAEHWTVRDIPPLTGKTALVTGGTSGIGYETALALAGAGAEVVLTGRNPGTGNAAVERIRAAHKGAVVCYEPVDTSNLALVRDLASRVKGRFKALDIQVNCAGLTRLSPRQVSFDGFEMQLAANYLGHFALTAHLLPLLRASPMARVVSLASIAHKKGVINFDDLQSERRYSPLGAYRQSKLAMLLFGLELNRRFVAHGWSQISVPAHPGLALTRIFRSALARRPLMAELVDFGIRLVGQSAAMGALPVLYAATAPDVKGGVYYGPKGFLDLKGYPAEARVWPHAQNRETAARLWDVSVELTGAHYEF